MINDIWTLLHERGDFFLGLLCEHLEISIFAIIIAILCGGLIGVLISEFQKSAKPTLSMINFLYTIPSISMLGFLIPFSGVGNITAIIALTVYALLPMVRNTYTGLTQVDDAIVEAAKGLGSTRMQILMKIKLPLALPVIMSGIRSMVTMTIALAGIASFIGAGGLGVAIYRGITTNNAAMTILGSLCIAILALVLDFLLGFIEKRIQRHHKKDKKKYKILYIISILVCCGISISMILQTKTEKILRIATKPMTEQYILGEMLDLLIEKETDLQIELTQGVGGGTSNIQPAMENGEFDLYPEYTGTAWNTVLKEEGIYNEDLFTSLQQRYEDELSMEWVGMYGFNNTYGIVVRKEIADQYNLETYSDLQSVANQLTFGAEYDFFEREDGYDALCETYDLQFKDTMDMDIGLKYQAIQQGKIDVMIIFTTDGQLASSDVKVLKDDKQFFPSYLCGNVIRSEVLEEYPELNSIFEKVTGIITDQDMAEMNYAVETEGKEPRDVAKEFLQSHHLL
ncbi:glycine betaine ABC transporter substrate-binding protein [Erysipelotrichaceae bacterium HCN-30851]